MKKYISILIILINLSCKSQENTNVKDDYSKLQNQIELLKTQNDSLEKKIELSLSSKNAVVEVVDKIDNLYNNNFNRFIVFWGIVASLIILGIPYYISQMQKKIIETKKIEIQDFSTKELKKLELKLYSDLQNKYSELSDLINNSNDKNRENLQQETVRLKCVNFFIASKINELDKNYDAIFGNLLSAILNANSIGSFKDINFYLITFLNKYDKIINAGAIPNKEKLIDVVEKFKDFRNIEEIDQVTLEKILEKIK